MENNKHRNSVEYIYIFYCVLMKLKNSHCSSQERIARKSASVQVFSVGDIKKRV